MSFTVKDLNEQAERIYNLREEEAQASSVKKAISDKLEVAEKQMIEMLESEGLKSFRAPVGTVSITHRTSVRTPKTPEDQSSFYEFLKLDGVYETMISVNSAKLNSYWKSKFEEAKSRGEEDFNMPGITEVTLEQNLSFRRA